MHQYLNYRGPRRRRGEKKGYEKIFEEVIVENFPNMEKEMVNQVQEAQRVWYRINPRRNMPRHILIKLTKTKTQRKNLKSSKGKATSNIQGKPHTLNSWSFSRNSAGQKGMAGYIFKYWKGKIYNQDYCTWQGSHSKLMEK